MYGTVARVRTILGETESTALPESQIIRFLENRTALANGDISVASDITSTSLYYPKLVALVEMLAAIDAKAYLNSMSQVTGDQASPLPFDPEEIKTSYDRFVISYLQQNRATRVSKASIKGRTITPLT